MFYPSKFFYNLANFRTKIGLKVNLEMMYLPKETFNKKGSTFTLVIGKPIKWETLDKSKTPKEWAEDKEYCLPIIDLHKLCNQSSIL